MSEAKRPRRPTVRQWLALDAGGSFLIACGVFFYSLYLLCLDGSWSSMFAMLLYTIPLPLTLDLAALLLLAARSAFPTWRVMTGVAAVIQLLVVLYHFMVWRVLGDVPLNLMILSMLAAGIAGLWAALFWQEKPEDPSSESPPNEET